MRITFLKLKKPLLVLMFCTIVLSLSAQHFSLINQQKDKYSGTIDKDYYQERIDEQNPDFDAYILTSISDHSIQFILLDENNSELWRKTSRSSWILVSADAPRIVMIGKSDEEGYGPGLGRTLFQGADILDFSGKLIYKIDDEIKINQAILLKDGKLLLSLNNKLRLYSRNGKMLWERDSPHDRVEILDEGNYIKTKHWKRDTDLFTLELLETTDGSLVKKWEYTRANEKVIMLANTQNNQVLMSEVISSSPVKWNIYLYDMQNWQEISALKNLDAGPFSPVWNSKKDGYCFLFLLPHNSLNNSDEIGMGFWNLNDGSLVMQSLGRIKIDFERDHLTYDIGNNQYNLKIGPTTYIYR